MLRPALLAAALMLAGPQAAWAVTLQPDSPIGRLVQFVRALQACGQPTTDAQQNAIIEAGQNLQNRLGASDADLDALVEKLGDGTPPGGCDAFRANFQRNYQAALAGAK